MNNLNSVQPRIIRLNEKKYFVTEIKTVCFGCEPLKIAECTFLYKEQWHIVKNVQIRIDVAKKYLEEDSCITKQFESAEGMYQYLTDLNSSGLYNPIENLYVFLYNDRDSLCTYRITEIEALELSKQAEFDQAYWSEYLGVGGEIYDGEKAMELCETIYSLPGWIKEDKYLNYLKMSEKGKE